MYHNATWRLAGWWKRRITHKSQYIQNERHNSPWRGVQTVGKGQRLHYIMHPKKSIVHFRRLGHNNGLSRWFWSQSEGFSSLFVLSCASSTSRGFVCILITFAESHAVINDKDNAGEAYRTKWYTDDFGTQETFQTGKSMMPLCDKRPVVVV